MAQCPLLAEHISHCHHIDVSVPPYLHLPPAPSYGELRLVHNDTTSYNYTSGRLEIYMNNRWGTICNDADFGRTEATVACQQLGWNGALAYGNSRSLG